jgi:hypothetical protein
MSSITDMIIFTGGEEAAAMARLNAWCEAEDTERQQTFTRLETGDAGGWKVFCSYLWAMGGNYVSGYELGEALPTFGWVSPENVVLITHFCDETRVVRAAPPRERGFWGE